MPKSDKGLSPLALSALQTARGGPPSTPRRHWSTDEIQKLQTRYANEPTATIAEDLGRSITSVLAKANDLGLAKSPEFLRGPHSGRLRGVEGASTRFSAGQTPWNSGMKGLKTGGRSEETRFKPGSKPQTWRPVGSERTTADGYLQRKMTDTGYTPRDWVGVHILVWMEHHGPIPEGHSVIFRDRNKQNITLENLELVSRSELMKRNTIHRYPPELKSTIRAVSKLKRLIKERDHEEQN